ncbi:hypothetical protein [Amnibacterium kyonggiense]|uniref:hypothetical protein n=1 Tax=Amnibacterium kyonggiense TaxID=595671 RepID=UPI00105E6BED|nr:hypothetical protein [Amnibacterium kyonggiense]
MQTVLYDSDGQGALSGDLPGGGDLMSVKRGSYVLAAACIGADIVHVAARAGGQLIGASDVPCGATVRIPISYESSRGLEIRVTRHDPKSTGSWYVSVNRASWVQTTSYAF